MEELGDLSTSFPSGLCFEDWLGFPILMYQSINNLLVYVLNKLSSGVFQRLEVENDVFSTIIQ